MQPPHSPSVGNGAGVGCIELSPGPRAAAPQERGQGRETVRRQVAATHPDHPNQGLARSLTQPPGPGMRRAQWEGPSRALGVHHMAWPANVQCRQERHRASPQASCEP